MPRCGLRSHNVTTRSGSGYGSGLSRTPWMMLNIAVFAPMPSASVSTATAVKPGFFSSWRKANLKSFMVTIYDLVRCPSSIAFHSAVRTPHSALESFIAQRLYRIDLGGAPRRQVAGGQSHSPQKQTDQTERQR